MPPSTEPPDESDVGNSLYTTPTLTPSDPVNNSVNPATSTILSVAHGMQRSVTPSDRDPLPATVGKAEDPEDRPLRNRSNAIGKRTTDSLDKDQYGWGNLPVDILQTIISILIEESTLDSTMGASGLANPQVALAVMRRAWLSHLREVSSGWCSAIDTLPYWTDYVLTLLPLYETPSQAMTFDKARAATHSICHVCLLHGTPRPPRRARLLTLTTKLGHVPTCPAHESNFCTHCMHQNGIDAHSNDLRLFPVIQGDRDELGSLRPPGMVCYKCRELSLVSGLRNELVECARGGPIRGTAAKFRGAPSYRSHVDHGEGPSEIMAARTVEEMFLIQQARWTELEIDVLNLQRHYVKLKRTFYISGNPWATKGDREELSMLNSQIYGDVTEGETDLELNRTFQHWQNEFDSGEYREEDCIEDGEILQSTRAIDTRLDFHFRRKLVDACITDWVNDRIRLGRWVMPSDEVDQLVTGKQIHTPFAAYSAHLISPRDQYELGGYGIEWVHRALVEGDGQIKLGPWPQSTLTRGTSDPGYFLPPPRLVEIMDAKFESQLAAKLESPFAEYVEWQRALMHDDDDAAERACAAMPRGTLLVYLREVSSWTEGTLARRVRQNNAFPDRSDPGGSTIHSTPSSPRVELVEDDNDSDIELVTDDFGIEEGWESLSPTEDDADDEPMLDDRPAVTVDAGLNVVTALATTVGSSPMSSALKRKSTSDGADGIRGRDTARPRLDDGPDGGSLEGAQEISHETSSSEVASSATAPITPHDSPPAVDIALVASDGDDVVSAAAALGVGIGANIVHVPASTGRDTKAASIDAKSAPEANGEISDDIDLGYESIVDDTVRRRNSPPTSSPTVPPPKSHALPPPAPTAVASQVAGESVPPQMIGAAAFIVEAVARASFSGFGQMTGPNPNNMVTASYPGLVPASAVTVSSPESGVNAAPGLPSPSPSTSSSFPSSLSDTSDDAGAWHVLPEDLPFIPPPSANLGPGASELIQRVWWNARETLRECRCKICERAKRDQRDMDRLLWASLEFANSAAGKQICIG